MVAVGVMAIVLYVKRGRKRKQKENNSPNKNKRVHSLE